MLSGLPVDRLNAVSNTCVIHGVHGYVYPSFGLSKFLQYPLLNTGPFDHVMKQ